MTNSADPDQLASEANWSGSTLFAKTGHVVFSKRRVKSLHVSIIVCKTAYVSLSQHQPKLNVQVIYDWLCWGLMTCQPLWVILCHIPKKGRKEIEEIGEEMKERDREERGKCKWKNRRNKNIPLYPKLATRPCPTVSQYHLDAPVT